MASLNSSLALIKAFTPSNLAFVSVSAKARICVFPYLIASLIAFRTFSIIQLSSYCSLTLEANSIAVIALPIEPL